MDEYRLTHHTQTDTFDKAKEPNLIQGAQVMAVTAMRVANLPELLPRDRPKGGVRRVRRAASRRRRRTPTKKDNPEPETAERSSRGDRSMASSREAVSRSRVLS